MLWKKGIFPFLVVCAALLTTANTGPGPQTASSEIQVADGTEPPPPPIPWGMEAVMQPVADDRIQVADGTEPPPPPIPWPKNVIGEAA